MSKQDNRDWGREAAPDNSSNIEIDELLEEHDAADVVVRKFGSKIVKTPLDAQETAEFRGALQTRSETHDRIMALTEGKGGTVAQLRGKPVEQRIVVAEPPRHTRDIEQRGAASDEEMKALRTEVRELGERLDWEHGLRGMQMKAGASPRLSKEDEAIDQAFRSAILERNPAPIFVPVDSTVRSYSQPGIERRDLLTSTAGASGTLATSVYRRIVDHMVDNTAVLRAGATLINTASGENISVPASTAFSTSGQVAEAALIGESDPTLQAVTLRAYKYAVYFEVSHELANDNSADLLSFLARQAGVSLALAYGDHLINGDGVGKPRGILTDAAVAVTGPAGTATSLGVQGTAGQGSDLLYDLHGSVAEPYLLGSVGWLMRAASRTAILKLKTTQGQPIGWPEDLGPAYVDPFVPAMAANAKSIIFGDMSRYFVRIAEGIRLERSDDFKFQNDLVCFKAIVRIDGALVDANGIKVFKNGAS